MGRRRHGESGLGLSQTKQSFPRWRGQEPQATWVTLGPSRDAWQLQEVGVPRQGCSSTFSLLNSQATEPAQPSALCKVWHGLFCSFVIDRDSMYPRVAWNSGSPVCIFPDCRVFHHSGLLTACLWYSSVKARLRIRWKRKVAVLPLS